MLSELLKTPDRVNAGIARALVTRRAGRALGPFRKLFGQVGLADKRAEHPYEVGLPGLKRLLHGRSCPEPSGKYHGDAKSLLKEPA